MSTAKAILADVLADESDWWAAEFETVSGYELAEIRELSERLSQSNYQINGPDRGLLYAAALGLIYCDPPLLEALETKALFGDKWNHRVEEFMRMMRGNK